MVHRGCIAGSAYLVNQVKSLVVALLLIVSRFIHPSVVVLVYDVDRIPVVITVQLWQMLVR